MKRYYVLIALLAILTTGCRAEVRLLLDVSENGSGTLAAEVGINQQLRDLIDTLAGDSESIISGLDLGLDGEGSTRVDGEMTVYTTEVAFDDVAKVSESAAGNFTSFTLDMTDDGTSLEATLDLAGELDLSQFPIDPGEIDSAALEARVIVSLPGEVGEHNADQVLADGRFAWDIPLDDELYMFASTVYPKASFPWWLVGLLALSVALAGAVWMAAVRRDKKKDTTRRRPAPTPPPIDGTTSAADDDGSPFFEIGSE